MDFVNFVIMDFTQRIIFVILVIPVVLHVLIVIIVFNVIQDIIGQLLMEVYVLLVLQDVLLVHKVILKLHVNHV